MATPKHSFSSIREYRDANDVTLEQLGEALGVDKATVWRWETGEQRVAPRRVHEVERITGVSRHDLRPDLYPRERERVSA
jgi:DNA-binding transcriptional regulator YdaS (Cro superfamily)